MTGKLWEVALRTASMPRLRVGGGADGSSTVLLVLSR